MIEIKAAKEVSDKKIEFAQRELSAKIKLNEAYLGDVRKGSEQEMNLRIKIVEQTAAKDKGCKFWLVTDLTAWKDKHLGEVGLLVKPTRL